MLAALAVTGAVPLTVGVILWVTGTVLQAGYHGGWSATAGTGELLIMAGLLCGLCMFVLAANSVRWTPRVPVGRARRALQQLASPEQQAWLADQPRPAAAPQQAAEPGFPPVAPPPGNLPPGNLPPGGPPPGVLPPGGPAPGVAYPAAEFPPDRAWAEPGSPPGWPVYPDPPGVVAPYLAGPGAPEPGGRHER
jgi:hypothetical protein